MSHASWSKATLLNYKYVPDIWWIILPGITLMFPSISADMMLLKYPNCSCVPCMLLYVNPCESSHFYHRRPVKRQHITVSPCCQIFVKNFSAVKLGRKRAFIRLRAESREVCFTLSRVLGCPLGVKAPPDRGKMSASASPDDFITHHPQRGEEPAWTPAAAAQPRNPVQPTAACRKLVYSSTVQ